MLYLSDIIKTKVSLLLITLILFSSRQQALFNMVNVVIQLQYLIPVPMSKDKPVEQEIH